MTDAAIDRLSKRMEDKNLIANFAKTSKLPQDQVLSALKTSMQSQIKVSSKIERKQDLEHVFLRYLLKSPY